MFQHWYVRCIVVYFLGKRCPIFFIISLSVIMATTWVPLLFHEWKKLCTQPTRVHFQLQCVIMNSKMVVGLNNARFFKRVNSMSNSEHHCVSVYMNYFNVKFYAFYSPKEISVAHIMAWNFWIDTVCRLCVLFILSWQFFFAFEVKNSAGKTFSCNVFLLCSVVFSIEWKKIYKIRCFRGLRLFYRYSIHRMFATGKFSAFSRRYICCTAIFLCESHTRCCNWFFVLKRKQNIVLQWILGIFAWAWYSRMCLSFFHFYFLSLSFPFQDRTSKLKFFT